MELGSFFLFLYVENGMNNVGGKRLNFADLPLKKKRIVRDSSVLNFIKRWSVLAIT